MPNQKPSQFCYWSVVDGQYARMIETTIRSARRVGVTEDFHVWTDRAIPGAHCYPAGKFKKDSYLFKFHFLREEVKKINATYLAWIDADNYFVRNPGDLTILFRNSPVHASLESDACYRLNVRRDWWGCPLPRYADLMRENGVKSNSIYNVNAGFWIVHRDAVMTFCDLALTFWEACRGVGFTFTEEAPLAYAMHMLCGNPYAHSLVNTSHYWASDWTGRYKDGLPDGEPWIFEDYFSGNTFRVNPAIVHAMRSKSQMIKASEVRVKDTIRRY